MSAAPRRRRVLMIEQGGRGGVADYTSELVAALAAEGWPVTLATAADHRYPSIEGVEVQPVFHYLRGRTAVARALRRAGLGPIVNGLRFLAALPRLAGLARRADIVHTQGWELPELGVVALACLRLAGRPIVHTAHGTFERKTRLRLIRLTSRRLTASLTARTIVHAQADLRRLAAWGDHHGVVIPHGEYGGLARQGGSAKRDGARAALGIDPAAPVTLMFGQLRTDKGLDDLVEAVRRVPGLHLLIGGYDAGGLTAVKAELSSSELRDRVTVRQGFLKMEEAARLFAAADTVALPYRAASQSGVLLLAYGFERPVIVYPTDGLVEAVLDGQTGWICASADVDGLAKALAASVQAGAQECLRRGRSGHALAEERYAWPVIARRTGQLYEELLADLHGAYAQRPAMSEPRR